MSTVRQAMIGFTARLYLLAAGFAASVIIARGIGPAGQGSYYLMLTVSVLLATLADFGVAQSAVVFSSDRKHSAFRLNLALLVLAGLGTIVVAGVATLIGIAIRYSMPVRPLLITGALILTPLTLYSNHWSALLVGRNRIVILNLLQCVAWTLFLILLLAVVLTGKLDVAIVVILHLGVFSALFLAQIVTSAVMFRAENGPPERIGELARAMFRFGVPGYGSTLSTVIYLRVSVLILGAVHGPAVTGVYSIAHQIADKLQIAVRAVQDAIYHRVVALSAEESITALNRYVRVSAFLFFLLAIGGVAAAPVLISLVFGETYRGAVVPLQMLICGSALLGIAVLTSTYFVGQLRRPGILSWLAGGAAIVAIVMSWVLIPRWGAVGAALSLLITQVIVFLASSALYARTSNSSPAVFLLMQRDDYGSLAALLQLRRRVAGTRS